MNNNFYINKQNAFDQFLDYMLQQDAVAIDTEFIREKTYFPKLCLLQLCTKDEYRIVDPFTVNISSISRILENKNIVKIFHAPRQDIEILYNKTGVLPYPIFDTQTAASFLGSSYQISYANLIHTYLGIKLKKSDSYSDWSARPLSTHQLNYAKDDVTYLYKVYFIILSELKKLGRLGWVYEDMSKFLNKDAYIPHPDQCFRHIKKITTLNSVQLSAAKEVSAWREHTAIKLNIPRRWVLSDEQVIEACKKNISSIDELFLIRGIKEKVSISHAREIVKCINYGYSIDKDKRPVLDDNNSYFNAQDNSDCDFDSVIELLNSLVKLKSHEHNIAPQILTSNSDLKLIAHNVKDNIETLKGWRYKILGEDLCRLVDGKISLYIDNSKLKIKNL